MSVAKVAIPASARRFAAVAAANTVIYTGYAMVWFGCGVGVFMAIGRRILGEDSPVLSAATTMGMCAFLGSVFLCPFSLMLVAARSMASVSNNTDAKECTIEPAVKGPRQILRGMLQDGVMVGALVSLPFLLLMAFGGLVRSMSPMKESGREGIGSILMDVGALGGNTVNFFIVIPTAVRRTWKMKYGGDAVVLSSV